MTTDAHIARVRREISTRDNDSAEWMRMMLVYGVPLGAMLLEADAAGIHSMPMSDKGERWSAAYAKAEALTGGVWRLGETHEIAIRHLWGLWTPGDMHEWRVFRTNRAKTHVEAVYFTPTP